MKLLNCWARSFPLGSWNSTVWRAGWMSFLLLLAVASIAPAQDTKKEKDIESKALVAADGWPLRLTYYRSTLGKEAAVVVLLHAKGESRLVWTAPKVGFAEQLHAKGFAVIALDMRKHGQSKPGAEEDDPKKPVATDKDKSAKKSAAADLKPSDYVGMVADLEAVKKFIFEEHQKGALNMRKMAIVAPAMSASVALVFTANDWAKKPYDDASTPAARTPRGQDVQALVMLSPETNVPQLQAFQVAPAMKATPIAALVIVGRTDPQDKDAKKLFQQLGGDPAKIAAPKKEKTEPKKAKDKEKDADTKKDKDEDQRLYFVDPNTKLRGTDLFGKKLGVEEVVTGFLSKHVQELKGPFYEWRDRQSRLTE